MSRRVKDRYYKAPTVLLYKVTSSRGSPSNVDKLVDWAIEELIGLASNILVFFKGSIMYLFWDRISPFEFGKTSTARKKLRLPRSLIVKSYFRWQRRSSMAEGREAITIRSST